MRRILARLLGVFVGALGLSLVWNGGVGFWHADSATSYAVLVLDLLAGPPLVLGGYWLWRRERRGIRLTGIGCAIAIVAGTLAAWHYTPGSDRTSATIGAVAAGSVLTILLVVLEHVALRVPEPEPEQLSLFSQKDL